MEKTQDKIGKIFTQGDRDAVHIAVLPVKAHKELRPGEDIGYDNGKTSSENPIGIVDPFLKRIVREGDMFFMMLYPNTITSLRHNWTHPAVTDAAASQEAKLASEIWIRDFIANNDTPSYANLIAAATGAPLPDNDDGYYSYSNDGEYLHFNGLDAHSEIPPELWHHVEVVTGITIPQGNRATGFSCSC